MFPKRTKGSDGYIYESNVKYGIQDNNDGFILVRGKEGNFNKFRKHDIKNATYGDIICFKQGVNDIEK
jgi:hypothetical protein